MMKNTFAFICIVALTACGSAPYTKNPKKQEVPTSVKDAFARQHPEVKDVEWEKEGIDYEAEFKINHKEYSVVFDSAGKILEEEMEIEVTELPKRIIDYIAVNYKGQRIKEAAKITSADGAIEYEAEISGKDLLFDSNGQFLHYF